MYYVVLYAIIRRDVMADLNALFGVLSLLRPKLTEDQLETVLIKPANFAVTVPFTRPGRAAVPARARSAAQPAVAPADPPGLDFLDRTTLLSLEKESVDLPLWGYSKLALAMGPTATHESRFEGERANLVGEQIRLHFAKKYGTGAVQPSSHLMARELKAQLLVVRRSGRCWGPVTSVKLYLLLT